MLATLILIACVTGQPCDPSSHAFDVRLLDVPASACTMNEPAVAETVKEWFEANPKRYFAGWRCQIGRRERAA